MGNIMSSEAQEALKEILLVEPLDFAQE